jgi:hypothetical protein
MECFAQGHCGAFASKYLSLRWTQELLKSKVSGNAAGANRENVIGHFTRTTLKFLIFILTVFLFARITSFDGQEDSDQSFKVTISYIGLPNPMRTKYFIDDNKLEVCQTLYDSEKDSIVDIDKLSFRKYDKTKLLSFLKRNDWKNVPSKLITPTIDGFQYTVSIVIEKTSYSFDIDNTYHPIFDSLFTICSNLIPTKKGRKKYNLYYYDRSK